jgi:hypothetical protein
MPEVKVSLFSQILHLIDRSVVSKAVSRHDTDKHCKGINTWTHLVSMLFCHLAKADSLRDISNGLRSAAGKLSHFGVKRAPCKSSISYINKTRDWKVFRDIYFALLDQFEPSLSKRRIYAARLKRKIFIMDSTYVPLCLNLFDWAKFRRRKGAIKLHTVLDYDTAMPAFIHMSDGKQHDLTVAKDIIFPRGSVVVMDKAYVDYPWLFNLDSNDIFFVTRLKRNSDIEIVQQYLTNTRHEHILEDADIRLLGPLTSRNYPKCLRIVRVYDATLKREFVFLTNQMSWTAETISQLYHARWDIETFFKAIKQTLKIKTFIGTSPNAVLIQVWTAMIAILILKYLRAKAAHDWSLSNMVSTLRIHMFSNLDLWEWIDTPFVSIHDPPSQPTLFE